MDGLRHASTKWQQAFDVGVIQLHHLRAEATFTEQENEKKSLCFSAIIKGAS